MFLSNLPLFVSLPWLLKCDAYSARGQGDQPVAPTDRAWLDADARNLGTARGQGDQPVASTDRAWLDADARNLGTALGRLRPLVGVSLFLLTMLGGWAWGRTAEAATVLFLSEDAMIRASSLIVEGQILRQEIRALGPRKRLVTESLVFVRRFLKGETASRFVTVRTMGGQDKERLQIVSGEASLRPGEQVILFLSPTPATPWERSPTSFVSVAMAWGVFYVRPHPATKVIVVERPRDLPHQMRPLEGGRLQPVRAFSHPAPVDRSVFLHELKLRIQKLHPPASSLPLRQAEARPLDAIQRGGHR